VTSDSHECGQGQDERTALSSMLTVDVNESEHVDDKGEDDVLCDLLSRHVNDVGSAMFRRADDVIPVTVQWMNDAEIQNSWAQLTNSSSTLENPDVEKTYACNVCPKTFSTLGLLALHRHVHARLKPQTHDVCRKSYTDEGTLSRQRRTDTGEPPYVCHICAEAFLTAGDLTVHMQTHADNKPHQCDVCPKQFATHFGLKRHTRIHTGKKPYECDACQKKFFRSDHLSRHMLTHVGKMMSEAVSRDVDGQPSVPAVVSSPVMSSSGLNDHQLMSLSTQELKRRVLKDHKYAQKCRTRRLDVQDSLKRTNEALCVEVHQLQETVRTLTAEPSRPLGHTAAPFIWYQTSDSHECGQGQDERTALSSTLTIDVNESEDVDDKGEDDMLCDLQSRVKTGVGSAVFRRAGDVVPVHVHQMDDAAIQSSWAQLANSSRTLENPDVDNTYACSVCRKTFSTLGLLALHTHIHDRLNLHAYDVCNNSYTSEGTPSKHEFTGVGEWPFPPYVCCTCARAFIRHSDLVVHTETHVHKPHTCDVCRKQFTTRRILNRHRLSHTRERPRVVCHVCQKTFSQPFCLKRHFLIHSGEKPHACDVCRKRFTCRGNLKQHMLRHTREVKSEVS